MSTLLDIPSRPAALRGRALRAAVIGTGKISEEHLRFLSGDSRVDRPTARSRELWLVAESGGRKIIEDHIYGFNGRVLAIERLVAGGDLGVVGEVDVRMALPIRRAGGR